MKADAEGNVTLRYESYRRGLERQRIAEALLEAEVHHGKRLEAWAREAFAQERRTGQRATYLYGLAASLGATPEQLEGQA